MSRSSRLLIVIGLLLACAGRVDAAIARRVVAEGHTNSGTTCATGVFSSNPVTGDTLVVAVSSFSSSTTFTAPTDTASNVYTQIGTTLSTPGAVSLVSVWRKENATGGSSFTATGNISGSSNGCTAIAWALSGAATTSYNADKTGSTGTSTNPASGTSTPAPAANSFFIAGMTHNGAVTSTAGASWSFETNSTQTDNATFQALYTEDLAAGTSSSAQDGQFTNGTSQDWAAQVQSFAPSGGTVRHDLPLLGCCEAGR